MVFCSSVLIISGDIVNEETKLVSRTKNLELSKATVPTGEIHKLTWCPPPPPPPPPLNGRDKNQIDHLMINGTCRRSLQDVRVRRGADVGSDHHLVMANQKLKLRRNGPDKARQQQFDIIKLKEPTFTLQLKNQNN